MVPEPAEVPARGLSPQPLSARSPPPQPHSNVLVESSTDLQGPPSSPHVSPDSPAPNGETLHTPIPKLETAFQHPPPDDPKPLPEAAKSKAKALPIPVVHGNPSQSSFVLADSGSGGDAAAETGVLPPEVASAEVELDSNGAFVQTTSALAARELKKIYDQILRLRSPGEAMRSPYAITAISDESGRQVFRIGLRASTEPTSVEGSPSQQQPSSYAPGHAAGPRRKARLSVHDFLPSSMSMFKPSASGSTPPRNTSSLALGSGSTPPTNGSPSTQHPGPRKLRKSRSNSDLHLRGVSSPPHAGSSTGGESSGHMSPPPRMESFAIEIRDEVTAGADAFSQVLGWSSELTTDSTASSRRSVKSSVPATSEAVGETQDSLNPVPGADATISRRPSVSTSAALSSTNGDSASAPFGENVRYTAPMRRSAIFLASQTPHLREVQSFESGLTARVGDDHDTGSGTPKSKSHATGKDEETSIAAQRQARFPTAVFEVLQTYRGLPLPSTLSENSTGATIKLSTTDSPNPKDDPRFVIWGEIVREGSPDDASQAQSSHTDLSASASSGASGHGSRKRSNARPPHSSTDPPQLLIGSDGIPQTVMIAATVERWIAQLTSELNYDELLNFLLTYRTYVSPVDLCHLLICRFHWALETPSPRKDDMVRKIVIVRTFIAIRYWVLTFFREDFLPNAELCQLFASWLNTLFRDPVLGKNADALRIVRKLKTIVRECKAAHSRHGRSGLGRPSMGSRSAPYTSLNGVLGELAQSTSMSGKKVGGEKPNEDDDSDVDLDFSSEANAHYAEYSTDDGTLSSLNQLLASSGDGSSHIQPTIPRPPIQGRSSATPSANSILLSQPLSATILGHVKSTMPGTDAPLAQLQGSLPVQHSAISRAFVNTIGRLGRWKRVLNSRSSVPAPHCGDVSAFDLELNATGDLLTVRGGVEEYLKMLNLAPPAPTAPPQESSAESESESEHPVRPPGLTDSVDSVSNVAEPNSSRRSSLHLEVLQEEGEGAESEDLLQGHSRESHESTLSTSDVTDRSSGLSSDIPATSAWMPDIVSLDDYDLSDSDSSLPSPARVRRLPRRLPLRRDFQFVRRSIESVSSMGIRSHSSVASSIRSSGSIRSSHRSSTSNGEPFVAGIQHWQIELIDTDDEEEVGDREAALRRLEGQIDVDRQREKDMKVGRWLRTAHERSDRDGTSSIQSGSQASEEDEEAFSHPTENEDLTVSMNPGRSPTAASTSMAHETVIGKSTVSMAPSESTFVSPGTNVSTSEPTSAKPANERDRSGSVGSAHIPTTSRPVSRPSSSAGVARRPSLLGRASRGPGPSKFGSLNVPPVHRSFILMHRSETLAQQFAIIEAQLFAKVTFEELISHRWGQSLEDVNVRDWVQFVKERAKLKSLGKALDPAASAKLSAILVLRARFDLLVNFTSSEVLLTHPTERVIVVEKFIRIAWKAYLHNNFSTLVALIAGLQTRWVNQAMGRQWHKVGMWEQRVYDDLRQFTSRSGEFKYLRNATATLVDARPLRPGAQDGINGVGSTSGTGSSKSRGTESRDTPSSCVPFLGMYLSQLYEHERLPDFVDPTAPAEPVLIDSETGTLSPPSHPEVFSNLQALPRDLSLEPLINVHKQRLIAGVIKSFVAGQHLATNIPFEVDHKSYQKCYRLRSLEPDALHSIAMSSPDS